MPRSGLFFWGCAALLIGAGFASQGDDAAPSIEVPPPPDDTVYVADTDSVVVVYHRALDTLVVRSANEMRAPVFPPVASADTDSTAAAGPPTEVPSADSDARPSPGSKQSRAARGSASNTARSGLKEGISVSGLVIDRTHSVIGRDFKDAFHNHWDPPEDVTDYTIEIREQPLPQFGSRLSVRVGEMTIYRGQLRPQYHQIEQAARRAAARARYYLTEFYEPREVY